MWHVGGEESCIQGFGGKPRGKKTIGRPWRRRENNIKMDLQGVRWGGMNWTGMVLDRDRWRALADSV